MTREELKPCPFCGKPPRFDKAIPAAGLGAEIFCRTPTVECPADVRVVAPSDALAIAAWNRRDG